jgi:aminoglycoside phosphotransferase (APT) family kinase protein
MPRMDSSDSAEVVRTRAQAAALQRPPLLILEALEAYLDAEGIGTGPANAEPLAGDHSNATFLISRRDRRLVLRRPPRPPLPAGAHNVVREGRVLSALERTGVPVPRVLSICESPTVIGAPFMVMEHLEGHVLEDQLPLALASPGHQHRIAEAFIEVLVAVHEVDIDAAGLAWLGRPSGYLERQLRRLAALWEVNRTRQLPAMTELAKALGERVPSTLRTTLVHGDARLGNAIFAPGPPASLAALLDWELAALGDPLADLGYLCIAWTDPRDTSRPMFHRSTLTGDPGWPTRDDLVALYERRSGRGATDLSWYVALAYWKAAVFMEGDYRRALYGVSDDASALGFRFGVEELAELGLAAIRAWRTPPVASHQARGIGGITARPQRAQ